MADDITPVLHRQTVVFNVARDLQQEVEINPARSPLVAQPSAPSLAKVESLVAVHVDQSAGKIRQQLCEQLTD